MANCIVFEDDKLIKSYNGDLWNGLFSNVKSNGKLIEYIQSMADTMNSLNKELDAVLKPLFENKIFLNHF